MRCAIILCLLLALCSCRKDLIRYQSATRIETHTSGRLNRILFVNDSLGFVCGGQRFDYSDILITRDGGRSWSHYSSPDAAKELFGIAQAPDGSVWFIGFDGKLLGTTDAGQSWQFRQLRYDAYKSLAFISNNEMMGVGGVSFESGAALHFDKGGNIIRFDSLSYELNDITLLPGGHGWRCGYGVMQHTVDSGRTWDWQLLRNDNFNALDVHSAQVAFVCGAEGSVCATHNGGNSWETLRNGNDLRYPKYRLQDLIFLDEQHAYAVGENGVVIYSDDSGRHWSELEKFTETHLHGLARAPNGDLLVCGDAGELWRIGR